MPYQAILLDLGNVLLRTKFSAPVFGHFAAARGVAVAELLGNYQADPALRDFLTGRGDSSGMHRIAASGGFQGGADAFCDAWSNTVFSAEPGMPELIGVARSAQLRIGILSDIDPVHWAYVQRHHAWISASVDCCSLSFESGWLKPDREAYMHALDQLDVAPQNCLFVDDRPRNVIGARDVGLHAVHYQGDLAPVLELLMPLASVADAPSRL